MGSRVRHVHVMHKDIQTGIAVYMDLSLNIYSHTYNSKCLDHSGALRCKNHGLFFFVTIKYLKVD